MRPIFLIGYMGSGKSTLGRAVSALSGLQFVDLDNYIEGRFHMSVRELFAQRGEEGFRQVERNMLHEVADFENVIVACGGGTPCLFDNMQYMNDHGITVFLDTSIDKLHSRLMRGRHKRPLIADKTDDELRQFIIDALAGRMQHYSQAQISFTADELECRSQISVTSRRFCQQLSIPFEP